jgi:uncharacterized membrane protein
MKQRNMLKLIAIIVLLTVSSAATSLYATSYCTAVSTLSTQPSNAFSTCEATSNYDTASTNSTKASKATKAKKANGESGKEIAIIAYITAVGLIIALVLNAEKKNPFAKYHIRQSLGLFLTAIIFSIGISMLSLFLPIIIGSLLSLMLGVLILALLVMGIINAANGEQKPLPLFGKFYEKIFKKL